MRAARKAAAGVRAPRHRGAVGPGNSAAARDQQGNVKERLLRTLDDYANGDIGPGICKEFEKHLAGFNPCKIVVDNVRRTITLYREKSVHDLPAPFRARLRRALRAKGRTKRARRSER